MNEEQLKTYNKLPPPGSSRLIDFDRAEIVTLDSFPPRHVLKVTGVKPFLNMEVDLVPLVYIRQPEYWGIEVVGRLRGIGLPAPAPYTVSMPLDGFIGTQGIEMIGATRSEKIEVPIMPGGVSVPVQVTEQPGFPEPNLFQLEGETVKITYGILRRRGEFLEYHDKQRDLTFSGAKCEIDSLESKIGKLITVTLEVIPDSHELTLTLLLPKINLEGQKSSFATSAIRTKHLTSIGGPALVKGPLQTYDVLSLRGIASQGD